MLRFSAAIVIHNFNQFHATELLARHFPGRVKFFVPVSLGNQDSIDQGEALQAQVHKHGFEVEMVSCPSLQKFDVEFAPYPFFRDSTVLNRLKVRYPYGALKEYWGYSPANIDYFDLVLTYGHYEAFIVSQRRPAIAIGYPRETRQIRRYAIPRKSAIVLPTYDNAAETALLTEVAEVLVSNNFRVIVRLHHAMEAQREPGIRRLLSNARVRLHTSEVPIGQSLGLARAAITGGSSALLDAIAFRLPVYSIRDPNPDGLGGFASLDQLLISDGAIGWASSAEDLAELVLASRVSHSDELVAKLFPRVGVSAAKFASDSVRALLLHETTDLLAKGFHLRGVQTEASGLD